MTRFFAVIALGTLLLGSPASAQVGNWLEGLSPTVPEQLQIPRAQAGNDWWETAWWDFCGWMPELCE
jgi:hypothetical protein